jgi:Sec-independent protein translocase protein TatA
MSGRLGIGELLVILMAVLVVWAYYQRPNS